MNGWKVQPTSDVGMYNVLTRSIWGQLTAACEQTNRRADEQTIFMARALARPWLGYFLEARDGGAVQHVTVRIEARAVAWAIP